MPIIKRKNPPVQAAKPDDLGTPVEDLIKEYDKLASDAEWNGNHGEAIECAKIAGEYRELLAKGVYYIKL